jgi:hypothetical protein
MTWIKLDSGFPDHPKVVAAGWQAAWLYICGLTYCSRYLTDGRIPKAQVRRLSDVPRPEQQAQRLLDAGLWVDDGNDYLVHDYTVWQQPSEKIQREREEGRKRAKASAEARAKKGKPPPEDRQPEVDVEVETSSSSSTSEEPPPSDRADEEDDEAMQQAKQQLADRDPALPRVANVTQWLKTTAEEIRCRPDLTLHKTAPAHPYDGRRPDCSRCDGLALIEASDGYVPCPDCTRSATA